jgi:hypothetical protein
MTNQQVRETHLADLPHLYADISSGNLPAVSFVKPGGLLDGHPTSSKLGLYEAFVRKLVDAVKSDPKLWPARRSLPLRTRAAATTIQATSSPSTSLAMARVFQ